MSGDRLQLMVLTDPNTGGRDLLEVVAAALQGGASSVQLRVKEGGAAGMVELGRALRDLTRERGALLLVNDRLDVALAVAADGVHLGDDDLPLAASRSIAPRPFLLGRSVDDAAEAAMAEREGADYLGIGPVYGTPSKPDAAPPVGLAGVTAVRRATRLPVVAIGGVDAENAEEVAAAGAHGVAVIRAVMQAPDPAEASRRLLQAVRVGRSR